MGCLRRRGGRRGRVRDEKRDDGRKEFMFEGSVKALRVEEMFSQDLLSDVRCSEGLIA